MPGNKNLRDYKKEATATALADAAFELAMEKGLDGFIVDDIVQRAGYSRRTFANHFACKEEAVVMAALSFSEKQEAVDLIARLSENTPPVDVLYELMRIRLTRELLAKIRKLGELARQHPALRPYMLSVVRLLQTECQTLVSELSVGRYEEGYSHMLAGAVFGALLPILDGSWNVLFPGQPASELPGAMTFEHYLDRTFVYLRQGF